MSILILIFYNYDEYLRYTRLRDPDHPRLANRWHIMMILDNHMYALLRKSGLIGASTAFTACSVYSRGETLFVIGCHGSRRKYAISRQ